jgi:hypothetical protein
MINWSNIYYWLRRISPYVATFVFFLLWFDSCHSKRDLTYKYERNLSIKNDSIKTLVLKNGQQAKQVSAYSVSEKELKKQVWVRDDSIRSLLDKLKKPKVVIKVKTETKFDTIFFPFKERIPVDFNRSFTSENPYYKISGKVDQIGMTLNPIRIYNTQRLAVDFHRGNPRVTVTNSNPYIQTNDIEGQVVELKKRKWVIALGAGWNIIQDPYVGLFAGYKIIQF